MISQVRKISRPVHVPAESQPDQVNPRVLLSLRDFAKRHHISNGTLHMVIHSGRIVPILVGPDGGYHFINISVYDSYQFGRWPKNRPQRSDEPQEVPPPATLDEWIKPQRLVSPADFAKMRKYSRHTVSDMIADGRIEPTLLGPQGQYQFIDLDLYEKLPMGRGK